MSETELKDTQPNPVIKKTDPSARRKFPGWLAVLVLVLLIAVGILGGYGSGMSKRYAAQNTVASGLLQDQYQQGLKALDAGQYEVARQHFEYIIQNNPDFPGVRDAYAKLLLRMAITPTDIPTSVPTMTSTPDLRGADQIYNNVVALLSASGSDLCARDWNGILATLDSLRKADSTYHTAEVDGMYYIALRNRGVCKIYPQRYESNTNCQSLNINLEGGIYDLTQAERFGPLDSDAQALRTWARMYIQAASFWDQDWVQTQNLFAQVMANMPNLSDSTCTSAAERWRQATAKYAQFLADNGDYCGAEEQFKSIFADGNANNEPYYPTATQVKSVCAGDVNAPSTPKP